MASRSKKQLSLDWYGFQPPSIAMDDIICSQSSCPLTEPASRAIPAGSGNMTVIDRELIRASPARDVPEFVTVAEMATCLTIAAA
jgi:hypothetical protein